jgi:hypothetical protein
MSILNKISWKTLWIIFLALVVMDVLVHALTGTSLPSIGLFSFK